MTAFVAVSTHIRRAVVHVSALIGKRCKGIFYIYLAAIFSVFLAVDPAFLHVTADMRRAAFDMMVRYRIIVPKPDRDILIVDINEASLASMAKE